MEKPFKMIQSNNTERWRYETLYTKEPETIEWIKSFDNGDVFWDIGANIGIYSLFCAATHPLCYIYSFEPSIKNFSRLNENVSLNKFERIETFMQAICDADGTCYFNDHAKQEGETGGQIGAFGDMVTMRTIDSLCDPFGISHMLPVPAHIKVDIDGQEGKVIDGMRQTLKCDRLKSVLIEFDMDILESYSIMNIFDNNGFTSNNRFNSMQNHSRFRRANEGILVENIIFTRKK